MVVPAVVFVGLAVAIPKVFLLPASPISHDRIASAIASLTVLFALSLAFFFLSYLASDIRSGAVISENRLAAFLHFSKISLLFGLFWAPVAVISASYGNERVESSE